MICKSNKNAGGKSNENCEEFLDHWKGADPGIAGIEDARMGLTELKQDLLSLS